MRLKLFKKFFFTTSVIILLSLTIMMLILTIVFNNHMAQENYESLSKACKAVADYTTSAIGEYNADKTIASDYADGLYNTTHNIGYVSDFDVFIADKEGVIRGCSCAEWGENRACQHSSAILPYSTSSCVK